MKGGGKGCGEGGMWREEEENVGRGRMWEGRDVEGGGGGCGKGGCGKGGMWREEGEDVGRGEGGG